MKIELQNICQGKKILMINQIRFYRKKVVLYKNIIAKKKNNFLAKFHSKNVYILIFYLLKIK